MDAEKQHLVADLLTNNPAATDEDLLKLFIDGGVSEAEARRAIALRDELLRRKAARV
jgi:hypothetical protein